MNGRALLDESLWMAEHQVSELERYEAGSQHRTFQLKIL